MIELYLGAGCYWSVEACLSLFKGVEIQSSGNAFVNHLDYEQKIEVVHLKIQEEVISLNTLLDVFFSIHNPTLVDWDYSDTPMARSLIIVHQDYIKEIEQYISNKFKKPIQTKIFDMEHFKFTPASDKNQKFYLKYPNDGFCVSIVNPKIEKMKALYSHLLK